MKKEKIIYTLVCTFTIIASMTVLLDFLYLRIISKVLQFLILAITFPVVLSLNYKVEKQKRRIKKISIIVIFFLLALFIYHIFCKNVIVTYGLRNFLQILFIYYWIFIAFSIPPQLLTKILHFIKKVFLAGVIISMIEFFAPEVLKNNLLIILYGELPSSYLSRDFEFFPMRLGSFYFTPLTFSYTLLFLICYRSEDKYKNFFVFIVSFLAQTKTAILGGLYILFSKKSKFINYCSITIIFSLVIYICTVFDGPFFYYTFDGTSLKSLSNHLAGLVYGVQSSFENLLGNGLGKSGFSLALEAKENVTLQNLYEVTVLENGNESSIGVIAYQLGGLFLILHLFLFMKIFYYQMRESNLAIASFVVLIIAFQFFSESALTLLILFTQAFLFADNSKKYNNKQICNENCYN